MDNLDIPIKIVATFDVEDPILGPTNGVNKACIQRCMSVSDPV